MEYELINPSDKIYFEADELDTATFVCLVVGNGSYGADPQGDGEKVPIFLFGGVDEWLKETLNTTVDNIQETFKRTDKKCQLIKALNSFCLASGERSSVTDICGYAHKLAKAL